MFLALRAQRGLCGPESRPQRVFEAEGDQSPYFGILDAKAGRDCLREEAYVAYVDLLALEIEILHEKESHDQGQGDRDCLQRGVLRFLQYRLRKHFPDCILRAVHCHDPVLLERRVPRCAEGVMPYGRGAKAVFTRDWYCAGLVYVKQR